MRKWLREMRRKAGYTQSDIAALSNVNVTMINKIELGERRPSVEVAKTIAEVLGFDWTRFYEDKTP